MFTRLSARLLLVLLLIILTACSLTSNASVENRVTVVPTDLIVNTPLIVTQTPFSETVGPPTATSVAEGGATVFPCQCLSPADWVGYRVVAGDTLAAIAQRTGITTAELATGNCLSNPSDIEVGQLLYVPPSVEIPSTPVATVFPRQCLSPADWVGYRVVAGDTLAAIAQRTGTTTDQLAAGNCLSNPNAIEAGQLLYVPPSIGIPSTAVATVFPRQCLSPADWVAYQVVAGDTLAAIARRTGTTTAELAAGNCLSNPGDIEVGQLLYVPPIY